MADPFGHCPTCGQPIGACDAIKPDTIHDVLPIRCTRERHHPLDYHEHPPIWPGTPALSWPAS